MFSPPLPIRSDACPKPNVHLARRSHQVLRLLLAGWLGYTGLGETGATTTSGTSNLEGWSVQMGQQHCVLEQACIQPHQTGNRLVLIWHCETRAGPDGDDHPAWFLLSPTGDRMAAMSDPEAPDGRLRVEFALGTAAFRGGTPWHLQVTHQHAAIHRLIRPNTLGHC